MGRLHFPETRENKSKQWTHYSAANDNLSIFWYFQEQSIKANNFIGFWTIIILHYFTKWYKKQILQYTSSS